MITLDPAKITTLILGHSSEGREIAMRFAQIESGKFTMGSPQEEKGRDNDEIQQEITIEKGFRMAITEVTQSQWKAIMGTTPWKNQEQVKDGEHFPASFVNWEDALAFCQKLSQKTGKTARLPTQSQWEFACRAGTTTAYSFGNDESQLPDYGWFGGVVGDGNAKEEPYAHCVGSKKPNPWGLQDMHGNMWEWCSDQDGAWCFLRGGCWFVESQYCRSADRRKDFPDTRNNIFGFRVCLDIPE
jgi:formylglycine-generating enzyme